MAATPADSDCPALWPDHQRPLGYRVCQTRFLLSTKRAARNSILAVLVDTAPPSTSRAPDSRAVATHFENIRPSTSRNRCLDAFLTLLLDSFYQPTIFCSIIVSWALTRGCHYRLRAPFPEQYCWSDLANLELNAPASSSRVNRASPARTTQQRSLQPETPFST